MAPYDPEERIVADVEITSQDSQITSRLSQSPFCTPIHTSKQHEDFRMVDLLRFAEVA